MVKPNTAVVLNQHHSTQNNSTAAAAVQSLCRTTKEPFDSLKGR